MSPRSAKSIERIIVFCFAGSAIIGCSGSFFSRFSAEQLFTWQIANCLFMAATTLMGVKLARENHDIPAAGFIMLTIAMGFMYSGFSIKQLNEYTFASGLVIFFPGIIFCSLYNKFPVFVRIVGILVIIPFFISLVNIYFYPPYDTKILMPLSWSLLILLQLIWSYFIWKDQKKL